jgi:hypothetical protein
VVNTTDEMVRFLRHLISTKRFTGEIHLNVSQGTCCSFKTCERESAV